MSENLLTLDLSKNLLELSGQVVNDKEGNPITVAKSFVDLVQVQPDIPNIYKFGKIFEELATVGKTTRDKADLKNLKDLIENNKIRLSSLIAYRVVCEIEDCLSVK